MDRFFKIMYDFFAFAFPGACIVVSVLLLSNNDGELFYKILPKVFRVNIWETYVAIALLGYLVGYLIKPLARFFLFRLLALKLYYIKLCRNVSWLRGHKAKDYEELYEFLFLTSDHSRRFIRIRERTKNAYQYIEFWDMHVTMSHNLAAACIIFIALHLPRAGFSKIFAFESPISVAILVAIIAIPILLNRSVYYAFWWMNDIKEASFYKESKYD